MADGGCNKKEVTSNRCIYVYIDVNRSVTDKRLAKRWKECNSGPYQSSVQFALIDVIDWEEKRQGAALHIDSLLSSSCLIQG